MWSPENCSRRPCLASVPLVWVALSDLCPSFPHNPSSILSLCPHNSSLISPQSPQTFLVSSQTMMSFSLALSSPDTQPLFPLSRDIVISFDHPCNAHLWCPFPFTVYKSPIPTFPPHVLCLIWPSTVLTRPYSLKSSTICTHFTQSYDPWPFSCPSGFPPVQCLLPSRDLLVIFPSCHNFYFSSNPIMISNWDYLSRSANQEWVFLLLTPGYFPICLIFVFVRHSSFKYFMCHDF